MSVYSVKGKGWRYDFTLRGQRFTEAWFRTKREANAAEHKRREDMNRPTSWTPTDMPFGELVNLRLDHVKAYHSDRHYQEYVYMARRWVKAWGKLNVMNISRDMVERFVLQRSKVSAFTANKEIRYLRATFNFGKKRGLVQANPVDGIGFLPVDKRIKTVPAAEDIEKVLAVADPETRDYLITVRDTMARISEVNGLTWDDVDLEGRFVVLYTRKKKGGHRTPRKVPMTARLLEVMTRRYKARDKSKPWVFWHRYVSSKTGQAIEGPYQDRKLLMRGLCRKAGVPYFRFHALRHAGASLLDSANVPIGAIQRILGHENRTTTEIYLHSIGDSERVAMQVFEQVLTHTLSHTDRGLDRGAPVTI